MIVALLFVSAIAAHTITILFTDAGYVDMTLALVARLSALHRQPVNVSLALQIWATRDIDCRLFRPFLCFHLPTERIEFAQFLQFRVSVMLAALENPNEGATGYLLLDSDVALFRNVAQRFDRLDADVAFQTELPCATRRCVNGGIWWARTHSESARAFVHESLQTMKRLNLPDQDAFDVVLARMGTELRVSMLSPYTHPNGFVYEANDQLEAARVHLVHANWCASHASKRRRLQEATRGRRLLLPTPSDSNRTLICLLLRSLDLRNQQQIMACAGALGCRMRIDERCAK